MTTRFTAPVDVMRRALELAERGRGLVEPNPMVGAVAVDDDLNLLGEGWHQRFGGPHAEVHASAAAGERCPGATLYCTLEPCAHHGKTPPCVDAVIAAGFRKVVIAMRDPAPHVDGRGIAKLQAAGIDVQIGLLENDARRLTAPFITLMTQGRPYAHAKWAMTLDGKIASHTGRSQWITNEQSRAQVHELRGRMDAILVGSGTALADDPLLTARPAGPRLATRIVLDSRGRLPSDSRLTRSVDVAPLLVVTTAASSLAWRRDLEAHGVEVLVAAAIDDAGRISIPSLLAELGRRRWTNLLVEGGAGVLGAFFDAGLVDECHVFIAPKILGGRDAPSPIGGRGLAELPPAFGAGHCLQLGEDLYCRLVRGEPTSG